MAPETIQQAHMGVKFAIPVHDLIVSKWDLLDLLPLVFFIILQ